MTRSLCLALLAGVAVILLLAIDASGAIRINELFVGPEIRSDQPADDEGFGREFFELRSTTGGVESLNGLWLVEINGEGPPNDPASNLGNVEQAINLGSAVNPNTGTNGLFLWRDARPNNEDLIPTDPARSENVGVFNGSSGLQASDHATYLLVRDYDLGSAPLGTDLDPDDDWDLDVTPWSSVEDALGIVEGANGIDGFSYANKVLPGAVDIESPDFGPDAISFVPSLGIWFAFDCPNGEEDPDYYGPFFAQDGVDFRRQDGVPVPIAVASQYNLTPGAANENFVPEPSSAILALASLVSVVVCRRSRTEARSNQS